MRRFVLPVMFLAAALQPVEVRGEEESADTIRVVDIEEVLVVASPKEHVKLRQQPAAVSLFSRIEMEDHRVTSLKELTSLVPNFFMPDYGSRLTSAIYIRGIGSRINTPAVGLYVDNVPCMDKAAFDFSFFDIERIDVLRGPQGTLYGQNTMGGMIKVHTKNPFRYQGTDLKLGAASGNGAYEASLVHYHRISSRFAFSAGGFLNGADGFFRNTYLDRKADRQLSGGGRMRAIWMPVENIKIDGSVSYEYSDEGGYAYGEADRESGRTGPVQTDTESSYRRGLFHAGLQVEWQLRPFTLSSVTGYENLNDRMLMDQDFSPASLYTLEQRQRLNAFSEELSAKSRAGGRWQGTTGVYLAARSLHTGSPVTFCRDGMEMLGGMINGNLPNDALSGRGMSMAVRTGSESMPVDTRFSTPSLNMALFHQSTFRDFPLRGLSLTVGMRLEHERMHMRYLSQASLPYDFTFSSPRMPLSLEGLAAESLLRGKLRDHYTEWLPKVALQYDLDGRGNLYLSLSKGYRSGGYNLQLFSDLTRNDLSDVMMRQVKEGCSAELDRYAAMGMPAQAVETVRGYLDYIPVAEEPADVREATVYRPEYSWNYEAGAHLILCGGRLQADAALFLMDTRDQQIARFVRSGLGRIMVNAGRSRSYGAELSLRADVTRRWQLNASCGYTRATFRQYDGGDDGSGIPADYTGRYVPFVPRHTLDAGITRTFTFRRSGWPEELLLHAGYTATGPLFWTESNDARQGLYGLYSGRISLRKGGWQADLWVRNLSGKRYDTFCFESMGSRFAQRGKPRQVGIELRFSF